MIHIERNVARTQAYGCWTCVQIGSIAIYFGRGEHAKWKLDLFIPHRKYTSPINLKRFS